MAGAACKDAPNKQSREEYFAEQDAYIKSKFNFVQNTAHPYTCTHFIFGKCTRQPCRQTHYEEFAERYKNYRNEFTEMKNKEREQNKEKFKEERERQRENERKQNEANIDKDKEWLDQNTRVCPTCTYPVEKGPGCDNMYCQKCKAPFNWDQMKSATGGKNEYKMEQAKRNASKWVPLKDLPSDSLQLFVVLTSGKSMPFIVQLESKVEQLMQQIKDKTDIPTEIQRLQYAGKQLNNDVQIKEYGFFNNSSIFMVFRLPGGF